MVVVPMGPSGLIDHKVAGSPLYGSSLTGGGKRKRKRTNKKKRTCRQSSISTSHSIFWHTNGVSIPCFTCIIQTVYTRTCTILTKTMPCSTCSIYYLNRLKNYTEKITSIYLRKIMKIGLLTMFMCWMRERYFWKSRDLRKFKIAIRLVRSIAK